MIRFHDPVASLTGIHFDSLLNIYVLRWLILDMLVDLIRQLLPAFREKLFKFVIADRARRLDALRELRQVEIFLALDLDPAGMPADRDFLYFLCFRLRCIAFSFVELEH